MRIGNAGLWWEWMAMLLLCKTRLLNKTAAVRTRRVIMGS